MRTNSNRLRAMQFQKIEEELEEERPTSKAEMKKRKK